MKKIFYILDPNGEFYSMDRTKRYKQLTGQALYAYLQTEEGKKKYFDVWKDDDREVMIGVEVPPERAKRYEAEKRRRRYIHKVMSELDISITSLDAITDMENETVSGEQALPSLSINPEEELMEKIEREELHKAIEKLEKEEQRLIQALFFEGYTERSYAKKIGVYRNAVHKQKVRILKKLKKFLENL